MCDCRLTGSRVPAPRTDNEYCAFPRISSRATWGSDGGAGSGEEAQMKTERGRSVTGEIRVVDGKYDVSDLLSSANTLTNPKVSKVQNKNTEL